MSDPTASILLVYPPSRTQNHCSCPMALTMLAAVLEKAGHQVHLVDANAAGRRRTTAEIVEEAASIRPDVIGVTLLTPLVKEAYRLASGLRGCGAKLIAGGPHATLLPEEPLAHGFDAVDEDLLERAARAGCVQIEYGVESGSPETLKRIHKPHTADMVRRVIPLTRRHGIRPMVFFILGFPWEDCGATDETLQLMKDISPHVVFHPAVASILIPFPSTEIYDRYKDQYGFADLWLSDDRTYDAPGIGTHALYERLSYRIGAVLDADFFHYAPEVKEKIHKVFRFMFASNLRQRGRLTRATRLFAFDLSRRLNAMSPALERAVFTAPTKLWQVVRGVREFSS